MIRPGDSAVPRFLPLALVLGAVAVVYLNSLGNPFHFDDEHSITGNPAVRSLSNAGRFFTDPQTFSRNQGSGMFRPLVVLSYAVNHYLGEYNPGGYHAVNLGLHLAVVGLLYAVLRQWGASCGLAGIGAALFGLSPLTAEPVNYISSRSESMVLAFALSSLLLYLRSTTSRWALPGSLVCFGLALLCKSVAVVLPVLLVAHEGLVGRRPLRLWWRWHAPYWVLAFAYVAASRQLLAEALSGSTAVRSWSAQVASQAHALVYYLKLLAFPWPLSVAAPVREVAGLADPGALTGLALAASLVWMVWRWHRGGERRGAFWLFWMAVVLLPTFVIPLNVIAAERRLYPALAGLVGFVVWGVLRGAIAGRVILVVILLMYGALTYQRNQVWATERGLWEDAARRAPAAVRPRLRLGVLLRQQGDLDGAERELGRAVALDPQSAPAWNNLGNVHASRGDLDLAAVRYRQALEMLPSYPEALVNLGSVYSRQGRNDQAVALFERALPLAGRRPEMLNNLGAAYLRAGRFARAEQVLREAVDVGPARPALHYNLGGALEGQGDHPGALDQYGRAIVLDPGYAKPYLRMAALLEREGRPAEAAAAYRSFLAHWQGEAKVAAAARARLHALLAGR